MAYSCAQSGEVEQLATQENINTQLTIKTINSFTEAEFSALTKFLLEAFRNVIGTEKVSMETIVKAIQDLKETTLDQQKASRLAEEAQKTKDLYGEASMPNALCDSTSLAGGVQLGAQTAAKLESGIMDAAVTHAGELGKALPVKSLERMASPDQPTMEEVKTAMFPENVTMTDKEFEHAVVTMINATNAFPDRIIPERLETTPGGQAYLGIQRQNAARLIPAQNLVAGYIADHAPTLEDPVVSWARDQWKQAGASGDVPGLVEGKMSQAALFNLLSKMRLANPNWYNSIMSMNDTGLLREIALMRSVELELVRRIDERGSKEALLHSIEFATSLAKSKEVEQAYSRAMGANQ
jgi:hypothetical protein